MRFLVPQSFTLKQSFLRARSSRFTFVALGLVIFASNAIGQTQETLLPPSVLKKLSVEELMNIEVTSVSKRPEKLSETASAIQVVTGEDIKRSGANLADALRLAPNLGVQQVNSYGWVVSARGFDALFANKLLVMIDGRSVYTPLFAGVSWDAQNVLLEDTFNTVFQAANGKAFFGAQATG